MDRYKALRQIADGIYAAEKISEIYRSSVRDNEAGVIPSGRSVLSEMLNVLVEYSPDTRSQALGEILRRSSEYTDAYREVKHHLNNARSGNMKKETLINMLNAVRPVANDRRKALIDKIVRVYEILNE